MRGILLFIFTTVAISASQIVGVLEDAPGHYSGEGHHRSVRAVFERKDHSWVAFPSNCENPECLKMISASFPERIDWTIVLSGRRLGKVKTSRPDSYDFYADIGRLKIADQAGVPVVGKRDAKFAGFAETPVYRPLVAVSQTHFDDVDKWLRTPLPPKVIATIRKAFRSKFQRVENCSPTDAETAHPWKYSDTALRLGKAYSSNRHWYLVEIRLGPDRCDGRSDEAFESQWFVINESGQAQFVGSGIWLIDAGDYDGDGKSELLFSIDRYNRGGYELFFNDFKQKAVFEFSYH